MLTNGRTTATTGIGGLGAFGAMVSYGVPETLAAVISAVLMFATGVIGSWARDVIAARPTDQTPGPRDLGMRFLAALGSVAIVVGATGCAMRVGPGEHGWLEVAVWDTASLEISTGPPSLCLGCYDNAAPPILESATVIAEQVETGVSIVTGPVIEAEMAAPHPELGEPEP